MPTIAARFQKLLPGLSGKERAILAARQQSAGQAPDPDLGRGMAPDQARIFDRYVALACAVNVDLGALTDALAVNLRHLEKAADHVALLEDAARVLEEDNGLTAPSRPVRDWRRRKTIEVNLFLRGLAYESRELLAEEVRVRWGELQAMKAVWGEARVEFDGEDPLTPELTAKAAATEDGLRDLLALVGLKPEKLGAPSEAAVDEIRTFVDEAFRRLGYASDVRHREAS